MNNTLGQNPNLVSDDFSIKRQLSVILQSSKLSSDDFSIERQLSVILQNPKLDSADFFIEKQKNTPTSSKARKGKSHNEVVNGTNQDKLKHSRNGVKRPAN